MLLQIGLPLSQRVFNQITIARRNFTGLGLSWDDVSAWNTRRRAFPEKKPVLRGRSAGVCNNLIMRPAILTKNGPEID